MARYNRRPPRKKKNTSQVASFPEVREKVTAITYKPGINVGKLAEKLKRNSSELIKLLFMLGKMVTINSVLDEESIQLVCMEFGVDAQAEEEFDLNTLVDDSDQPEELKERAPVVTIMGHVDHGKTTLLDYLRSTKVVESEYGGITQHIGAYQVKVNDKAVTFLDTPGHEAFTQMRARGAQITDVCIIVVAADDGVMPQTKEAVDHAKAAKIPIIVAINKMDKEGANPEHILSQMSDLGVVTEEWGGDTIFARISAKTGEGIDELLKTILVVTEVAELKANPNKLAYGTVIEAKLDKGRGPVATLLVQNGTLKTRDNVVVGTCLCKVRKMTNDTGKEIKEAYPSMPVEIIGLSDVPEAGDIFKAFASDKEARSMANLRSSQKIQADRKLSSARSLEDLAEQVKSGNIQSIPLIIKADVQGSAEALRDSLEKIEVEGIKIDVLRSSVGNISESDIMLADASKGLIIGFNIRPDAAIRKKAEEGNVEIRLYNIIYKVIEDMQAAMKGMLAPVFEEAIIGQAEVRQLYKVSKIGTIAGCMVTDGKVVKDCKIRLIRDGIVVYTGKLNSLKRFQNDAKEVTSGHDCGLTIENYNDIKENDIIEAYADVEVPVV